MVIKVGPFSRHITNLQQNLVARELPLRRDTLPGIMHDMSSTSRVWIV